MTEARDRLRLFVALMLPEAWLEALGHAQADLRRAGLRLRYVRPEGIHLTLKFLGEVEADRLAAIAAALRRAAAGLQPFDLELAGFGSFGAPRRPRVIWADLRGDLALLSAAAEAVDAALAEAGFAREERPFRPHLTLARVPETFPVDEAARIAPALAALARPSVAPFRVEEYALVRSALGPGGARYTVLDRWSFPLP